MDTDYTTNVFDLLKSIVQEKQDKGIVPCYSTDIELLARCREKGIALQTFRKALRQLYANKSITTGKTINNYYLKPIKTKSL